MTNDTWLASKLYSTSRDAVRAHDARLMALDGYAPAMRDDDDEQDDDDSEETETRDWLAYKRRDSIRFRLPSQSSRGECLAEMRALGMAWES